MSFYCSWNIDLNSIFNNSIPNSYKCACICILIIIIYIIEQKYVYKYLWRHFDDDNNLIYFLYINLFLNISKFQLLHYRIEKIFQIQIIENLYLNYGYFVTLKIFFKPWILFCIEIYVWYKNCESLIREGELVCISNNVIIQYLLVSV